MSWKKRRIWAGGAAVVLSCVVLALGILLRQGLPILNGYWECGAR